MTEECISRAKIKGYKSIHDWCKYLRENLDSIQPSIVSTKNLGIIPRELDNLHSSLSIRYGLSRLETGKYFLIYFENRLWNKYYDYVKAKQSYFGLNSNNK